MKIYNYDWNIKSVKRIKEPSFNGCHRYWKITYRVAITNSLEEEIVFHDYNFYDYTQVGRHEAVRKLLRDLNRDERAVIESSFRPGWESNYKTEQAFMKRWEIGENYDSV